MPRSSALVLALTLALFVGDAPARADVTIEKGIAYLGPDRKELADLYLPPAAATGVKRPGCHYSWRGWTGGKRDAAREINIGTTLAQNGYVCLSIDYMLQDKDPQAPKIWPQNVHDCKTAVRWLRAHAGSTRSMRPISESSAAPPGDIWPPCWA